MVDGHVLAQLSARLDGELPPQRAAEVDAHLAACASCAARSAELRATARLIAAAPAPRSARALVPPLVTRYRWLRPLRSLMTVSAGAFLLLFIASSTLASGSRFGGGGGGIFSTSASRAMPAASGAGAAAAPAAAPGPQGAVGATASAAAQRSASTADSAQPKAGVTGPGGPPAAEPQLSTASRADQPAQGLSTPERVAVEPLRLGPPWLWLALALACAAAAIVAHRRLAR